MSLDEKISEIYHRVSLLSEEYKRLKAKNQGLQTIIEEQKEALRMMNEQVKGKDTKIDQLSQENDALKISQQIKASPLDKDHEIKGKINHLISEVDKCINLLSN